MKSRRSLTQNRRGKKKKLHFFCYVILVVYPGHGIFSSVAFFLFVSPNGFLGEVLSSQIEENLRKKAAHLYRSTRQVQSHLADGLKRSTSEKRSSLPTVAMTPVHDPYRSHDPCP